MEMLLLEDEITRQESDAWNMIVESAMQVRQSYDGLSIAAENLSLSTFAYNEGQLTVLDVLSAQLHGFKSTRIRFWRPGPCVLR